MQRASSLFAAGIVPVVVALVLTVRPARLYAESAPAPPTCDKLDTTSCEGKVDGEGCGDAAPGSTTTYRCQLSYCREGEGGASTMVNKIACKPYYVPGSSSSGSSGSSGTSTSGGPTLGVPITDADGTAPGSTTGSDDGGCSTAGSGDSGRAWAAALGLFVMATAIKRRLRRG